MYRLRINPAEVRAPSVAVVIHIDGRNPRFPATRLEHGDGSSQRSRLPDESLVSREIQIIDDIDEHKHGRAIVRHIAVKIVSDLRAGRHQCMPRTILVRKAIEATSITAVAIQPTVRRYKGSVNSRTTLVLADMNISMAIIGAAATPFAMADQ